MAFEGTLQEITVRMHGNETKDTRIEVQQGDTASRKVRIRLKTFGGADYIIPYGASAVLCIRKNDGKKVYDECDIEDKNTLLVTLSDQAISCSGLQKAQIYIFSEEGDIKTQVFQVNVPKAVYSDDAIESSDEFGILHELIVENSAIQQAEQMRIEAEATRTASEEERQANAATMATATEACLAVIEDARAVAYARGNAIVQTASGTSIVAQDSSDDPVRGLRLFGRTTQDGTPAPDAPVPLVSVGDAGSVEVGVYGGNLLDYTEWSKVALISSSACEWKDYGVAFTASGNDAFTSYNGANCYKVPCKPNTTYTISWELDTVVAGHVYVFFNGITGNNKCIDAAARKLTFTTPEDAIFFTFRVGCFNAGTTIVYKNVRINLGDTVLPFEPYHKQTLTAITPNGLPGIKVTDATLANYTDSDGNMWCSDEVDFGRRVYIQRLVSIVLDGTEAWEITSNNEYRNHFFELLPNSNHESVVCTHYAMAEYDARNVDNTVIRGINGCQIFICDCRFNNDVDAFKAYLANEKEIGNPVICYCRRETPIETPLSETELAAYRALHSNYPATTVLNDSDAHMEVEYNADTKAYIDNKFAELQTALVALGGN